MQKCANLVELEKCCQTHIFLQNFDLIQPRTSPPKILQMRRRRLLSDHTIPSHAPRSSVPPRELRMNLTGDGFVEVAFHLDVLEGEKLIALDGNFVRKPVVDVVVLQVQI